MTQALRAPIDFQRTIELVNKFTLTSVQFLNRFGAHCEKKLLTINRQLQRLETQVALLEYKLDSIDRDDDDDESPAPAPAKPAAPLAITSGPSNASAPPPPPRQAKQPPPPPGMSGPVAPQMPGFGASAPTPAMPGGKMPPPPPGMSGPPRPVGAAPPLALMPPPQLGQAPAGFSPPPPPPMQLGVSAEKQMRNHPRLQGYFRMLDAGVPPVAVKQKMQVDGLNPVWLDTPEALAPAGIAPPKNDTLYDSD
jgi:WASH complex subunit CCDC53